MFRITPTALRLFGLTIHWYGVIIALGMALAVGLAALRCRHMALPRDTVLDLALIGIPSAIVGARLYYVLFSWPVFAGDPAGILRIWEGGMAIYGGILGGVLAGWVYARRKKLPFFKLADLAAPSIALGQAIGRWGNFVNQEAYGAVARRAWQQHFPIGVFIDADGLWHFATFFYESAWCFLIVAALLAADRRRLFRRDGDCFIGYVFLYALERALVEGLRADSLYLGGMRASQLLSLAALLVCAALMLRRSADRKWPAAALVCCAAIVPPALSGRLALALAPAALALVFAAAGLIKNA